MCNGRPTTRPSWPALALIADCMSGTWPRLGRSRTPRMPRTDLPSCFSSMAATLQRFLTSLGTQPMLGSSAQYLKTTSCRFGRWQNIYNDEDPDTPAADL